ncbi:hypothetical protein, partial [Enterobacter asburiae]
GEAQIDWPNALGALNIHPQRGERARLRLQLLVKPGEAAVLTHHNAEFFGGGQQQPSVGMLHILRQGVFPALGYLFLINKLRMRTIHGCVNLGCRPINKKRGGGGGGG